MNFEYIGAISQYLLLVFIMSQFVFGVVVSVTTALVASRLKNRQIQKDLDQNKEEHKEIKAEIRQIHEAFNNVVKERTCKSIRTEITATFCRKIDEIKAQMHDMDDKQDKARTEVDRLIGKLMQNGS